MRLFTGIELSPEFRAEVWQASESVRRQLSEQVRFTKEEQLHITLSFLGEVIEDRVPDICQALDLSLSEHTAFEMSLGAPAAFPNLEKPRVLWIGLETGAIEVGQIFDVTAAALAELGFEREERGFTAHITLGRVRRKNRISELADLYQELHFPASIQNIQSVTLFRSELLPQGSVYHVVHQSHLSAAE